LGGPDWVFKIDNKAVTHRPDLWGHRGIAYELGALWRRSLEPLDVPALETAGGPIFPVRIDSPACGRYLALPIDGVMGGPSPEWLRLLLLAAGQRPIDLVVDLSNFVMLDLGQPNHLFDRDRIAGGIEVRDARPGESMSTLDGERRWLEPGDLLICSEDVPIALAGIMGAEASKVAAGTSRLLLEVAHFDAGRIRSTANRLGLRSEASARFEKSLDPTLVQAAAAHLVALLGGIQPGIELPSPPTDAGSWVKPGGTVAFRPARARTVLGVDLDDADLEDKLRRLGFEPRTDEATWAVEIPSHRATGDIEIEEDLIEEIGRLHGLHRIEARTIRASLRPPPLLTTWPSLRPIGAA
jgi:phenylalanyl-tRNA synthetase beta chain